MLVFNIIMLVSFAPIPLIFYFLLRSNAKVRKNILIGVTLPYPAHDLPEVTVILNRFKKKLLWSLILSVVSLPLLLIPYMSISTTLLLIWLDAIIVLFYGVYVSEHKKLRSLKRERGWTGNLTGYAVVDTAVAAEPKKPLSIWWFAPAFVISGIPVAAAVRYPDFGAGYHWALYGTFSLMVAVFYVISRFILRQRSEVVDSDTAVNSRLTRVRVYNWNKCWILSAWLTALYALSFWLLDNIWAMLGATCVFMFLQIGVVMQAEFKTRSAQASHVSRSGQYVDEDDFWLFGMLYNNPGDRHVLKNDRVGIGQTVNIARAGGMVYIGITLACMLTMPLIGIPMIKSEFSSITLAHTDSQLTARHSGTEYVIEKEDVVSVELLDSLPKASRTNGTSMTNIAKGTYSVTGYGSCRLCLNPNVKPYVVLATLERAYIFGGETPEETMAFFNAARAMLY